MTLTWCCCSSSMITVAVATASSPLPRPSLLACSTIRYDSQLSAYAFEQTMDKGFCALPHFLKHAATKQVEHASRDLRQIWCLCVQVSKAASEAAKGGAYCSIPKRKQMRRCFCFAGFSSSRLAHRGSSLGNGTPDSRPCTGHPICSFTCFHTGICR